MFALPQGKKEVLYENGLTQDIITAMEQWYKKSWQQSAKLAEHIRAESNGTTRGKIATLHAWLRRHIRYVEDPDGKQIIKTPAAVFHTSVADCKGLSLLGLSVLQHLGIPAEWKFVGYKRNKAEHVYIVAYDQGERLYLDACLPKPFTEKKDYIYSKYVNPMSEIIGISGIGCPHPTAKPEAMELHKAFLQQLKEKLQTCDFLPDEVKEVEMLIANEVESGLQNDVQAALTKGQYLSELKDYYMLMQDINTIANSPKMEKIGVIPMGALALGGSLLGGGGSGGAGGLLGSLTGGLKNITCRTATCSRDRVQSGLTDDDRRKYGLWVIEEFAKYGYDVARNSTHFDRFVADAKLGMTKEKRSEDWMRGLFRVFADGTHGESKNILPSLPRLAPGAAPYIPWQQQQSLPAQQQNFVVGGGGGNMGGGFTQNREDASVFITDDDTPRRTGEDNTLLYIGLGVGALLILPKLLGGKSIISGVRRRKKRVVRKRTTRARVAGVRRKTTTKRKPAAKRKTTAKRKPVKRKTTVRRAKVSGTKRKPVKRKTTAKRAVRRTVRRKSK